MTTPYTVIHNKEAGRFEVALGERSAVLIYIFKSGLFILLHTEVPEAFEGKGIAALMTRTALEYARDNGLKIRSYCSFITKYIERHPEFKELLG